MRKATVAERILALTTTADCAAAVVGDLLEEKPSRGRQWFWLTIARTVVAFAWLNFVRFLSGQHSAFAAADITEPIMTFLRFVWSRKWLLVTPIVLCTMAASLVAYSRPVRYRSTTRIVVVPQRVPTELVRSSVSSRVEDRLTFISQQILSRARLERIVQEFNLYPAERRTGIMEDILQKMRTRDIRIGIQNGNTFEVSYQGDHPRTVQKVTERLASLFIEENVRDRTAQADNTTQFLDSRIGTFAEQVDAFADRMTRDRLEQRSSPRSVVIEYEELQNAYRALLAKRVQAQLSAQLEQRQISEQFRLLDPARVPEQPEGLDRLTVTLLGAGAGLVLGLVLMLRSSWQRPAPPAAVAAPA